MGLVDGMIGRAAGRLQQWLGTMANRGSETGQRATPENSLRYLYRTMWVDPDVRQAILDIREMDRLDGRVRRIHARIARDTVKGGLVFTQPKGNDSLRRLWNDYARRLQLNNPEKLKSDARGLAMEGNLPLQWVLDEARNVVAGVRMPSETILPDVDGNGRFKDVRRAYVQVDPVSGGKLAEFALWQLTMARFDPDSFDDAGAMGRPFLDATRTTWRKLRMTEEDLVIRRRVRAPLRLAHVLEGADDAAIAKYRAENEREQGQISTDFYLNKKGGVSAVQGDANLDQIGDVVHLLDTFFAGSPLPKGLMGYNKDMARDILEDIKRDYYDEIDLIQDTQAFAYRRGFELDLLLRDINPDDGEFTVKFAERRTETPNQTTDRMLKWQALSLPPDLIWEEMGMNAQEVQERKDEWAKRGDPYPNPNAIGPAAVKITPGNAPKGESAAAVTHSNRLSDHWPEPLADPAAPGLEAVKALGEIGRALTTRPDPVPVAPTPMVIHFHDAPSAASTSPPQPIQLTAELKFPEGFVRIPDLPTPEITVHIPQAAAPVVNVAAPQVRVEVAAPAVTLEASMPTPEITVKLPPRKTTTTVLRDRNGEMVGSESTEIDAE